MSPGPRVGREKHAPRLCSEASHVPVSQEKQSGSPWKSRLNYAIPLHPPRLSLIFLTEAIHFRKFLVNSSGVQQTMLCTCFVG